MRITVTLLVYIVAASFLLAGPGGPETPRTVLGVAFSPDGKYLAAAIGLTKERGTVNVWDVPTQKLVWKFDDRMGIPSVAFAPDGRTMAVAMYDKAAKLLDAATGKEIASYAHSAEVRCVAFSPDGKTLATACWDGGARIWDIAGGLEIIKFGGPKGRLRGVQFSPDGKMLLTNGDTDLIKLRDIGSGAVKLSLNDTEECYSAQITSDGSWLFGETRPGSVRLWDIKTGQPRVSFSEMGSPFCLSYSSKTQCLAVCSGAHWVYLYDLPLREPTSKEHEHIAGLIAKFNDDSYDLREATSSELLKIGFIAEAQLSKAMKESASAEVRIRTRTVREQILKKPRTQLYGHTEQAYCVAFSPDGKLLASGAADGTVRLWDFATGKEIAMWNVH